MWDHDSNCIITHFGFISFSESLSFSEVLSFSALILDEPLPGGPFAVIGWLMFLPVLAIGAILTVVIVTASTLVEIPVVNLTFVLEKGARWLRKLFKGRRR